MNVTEWAERHGAESARKWFGLNDHLVLIVCPNRNVAGRCGRWVGSEPLADKKRNPDIETACQRIRDALENMFKTEETIFLEG